MGPKKSTPEVKSISVIIPAWNEEACIEETIKGVPSSELEAAGYTVQILVVDGDSNDGTVDLARRAGAEVITELRRGYGRAYKTGFATAKGDIIVTVDADGTYPVQDIPKLVRLLEDERLDFITTNRFALMGKGVMSFRNRIGNTILAIETRLFYNLKMRDPESGMWVFRRNILDGLKLKKDNNTFSHEIKLEACYFVKCQWREVPIRYYSRAGGQVKLTDGWDGWKAGFANLFHIAMKRLKR